jgi:hypothetical protein
VPSYPDIRYFHPSGTAVFRGRFSLRIHHNEDSIAKENANLQIQHK